MQSSWTALKTFVRDQCGPGTEAWILSGNREATRHLGLRRSQMMPFQTGQQMLRWLQYEIRSNNNNNNSTNNNHALRENNHRDDNDDNDEDVSRLARRQPLDSSRPGRSYSSRPLQDTPSSSSFGRPGAQNKVQRRDQTNKPANRTPRKKQPVEENEWLIA